MVQPVLMQQPMFIPPMMMQQPYAIQPMAVQQPYAVQPMMMQNVHAVQNPQTMQQLQLMQLPQSQSMEQTSMRQYPQGIQQFQNQPTQGPGSMESKLRDFECMQPALSIHGPASVQPNCTSQTSATIEGNDMYAVVHVNDENNTPMQRAAVNERIDDPPPYIKILKS